MEGVSPVNMVEVPSVEVLCFNCERRQSNRFVEFQSAALNVCFNFKELSVQLAQGQLSLFSVDYTCVVKGKRFIDRNPILYRVEYYAI